MQEETAPNCRAMRSLVLVIPLTAADIRSGGAASPVLATAKQKQPGLITLAVFVSGVWIGAGFSAQTPPLSIKCWAIPAPIVVCAVVMRSIAWRFCPCQLLSW